MATIYRFIVEQRQTGGTAGGTGRSISQPQQAVKSAAKKGRMVSLFGGERGGVEHNRKMRAINPLLNRMTGGAWEKGMRVGRAATGVVKINSSSGKLGISGPAIAIIIAFIIQQLMRYLQNEQQRARQLNAQNFKQMENGIGVMNGQYKVSVNFWTGRLTYNQNK